MDDNKDERDLPLWLSRLPSPPPLRWLSPFVDPSVSIVTRTYIFRLDGELMFPDVWSGRSPFDVFGRMSAIWIGQDGGERESQEEGDGSDMKLI